jgi:hypothetical protein
VKLKLVIVVLYIVHEVHSSCYVKPQVDIGKAAGLDLVLDAAKFAVGQKMHL